MDLGALMMIEFFAFFGGILLFGAHQLWSLKKLDERDARIRAEREARGETPDPPAPPIPGWMARR
jgi:hypothetical protein